MELLGGSCREGRSEGRKGVRGKEGRRADGWMAGWMHGRMGGWMDGWIDGWREGGRDRGRQARSEGREGRRGHCTSSKIQATCAASLQHLLCNSLLLSVCDEWLARAKARNRPRECDLHGQVGSRWSAGVRWCVAMGCRTGRATVVRCCTQGTCGCCCLPVDLRRSAPCYQAQFAPAP